MEANLVEIFSSVQGEGPDVGTSTLFIRFGACDLRCRWCDSADTWHPAPRCRIETKRGEGRWRIVENPVAVEEIVATAEGLGLTDHRFVSLTGGEPLLQPEAVAAVCAALRPRGARLWLETHGLHADALARVVSRLDVVSMDWKLASDVRRESDPARGPIVSFHADHESFLEVARKAPRVVVKLVITPRSTDREISEAVRRVAAVHPEVCLVLQPVTPCGGVKERPAAERMLALARQAEALLPDVRVIPQTHPVVGVP